MPFFGSVSHGAGAGVVGGRGGGAKPYLLRQVITRGYLAAGYKSSVTYKNVGYVTHSNDTWTSIGDLISSGGGYVGGNHDLNVHYVWGTSAAIQTNTANYSKYNMTTQVNLNDATGPNTWQDAEGIQDSSATTGGAQRFWVASNGATVITRYDPSSNTFLSGLSTSYTSANFTAYHYGENWGYWWGDAPSTSTKRLKFVYSTETQSTPANVMSSDATQKGWSSKLGYGYGGATGSITASKWSYATESISSTVNKPITSVTVQEENFDMGQDHNYMLGMYDGTGGVQNNRSWRWNYATDSGFEGGAGMQPSAPGIAGRSSGDCAWK
jgi:hypothetical protein